MPTAMLLNVQNDLWLEIMVLRWTVSSHVSLRVGGTGTQSGLGKPLRWSERWVDAVGRTPRHRKSRYEQSNDQTKGNVSADELGTWLHGVRIPEE